MKQVWKCDFCSHTHKISSEVKNHEIECCFNPINKFCYTCKYQYHDDIGEYGSSYTICELREKGLANLSVLNGEEDGNCKVWATNDEQLMRKLKLDKLKNI